MRGNSASVFSPPFFRIFVPFGLGYFMSMLIGGANAIMSQTLVDTFGLSPANLGLMASVQLMAFGFMQFPLGIMLDRYGPRVALVPLLLLGGAGSFIFGLAQNTAYLIVARALIGIGFAGCLMAGYKSFAEWLSIEKLPVVYSLMGFVGGVGGMAATRPLGALFDMFYWRTIFMVFAGIVLCISASIWFVAPEKNRSADTTNNSMGKQILKMLGFLVDRRFWRIAPLASTMQGVLFAYLQLWLGPWLRDVGMMSGAGIGHFLMLAALGAALGYLLNGIVADILLLKGWMTWENMYLLSGVIFTVLLGLIAAGVPGAAYIWPFVIFLSTMSMISFPLMRNLFDENEVGRVLSLLNFMIFFFSFVMQWFVGFVIELFPFDSSGFSPKGYAVGLAILTIVNAFSVVLLFRELKKKGRHSYPKNETRS